MHPNEQLLTRFYTAFAARDGATMAACYAPDASFDDPVFSLRGAQVGAMWRMLCANAREFSVEFSDIRANGTGGSANWQARYLFSQTGRRVHNIIASSFTFRDGLIAVQRDVFDFWRWSRQALGAAGWVLGWSPPLRAKVRAQAGKNLERWIANQGSA